MKWSESCNIRFHDTDASGILSPAMTLRLMEEVGNNQVLCQHPTWDELKQDGLAFLMSTLRLRLYRPIRAYETVQISTWACESKGVLFNRCYTISQDGQSLAEINSVWALIHLSDRKILRVKDISMQYDMDEILPLDKPVQVHIPLDVTLEKIASHTVRYSETDYIHHMNNTRYLDLLCDFIPEIGSCFVTSVGIKYRTEAPLGENLDIYRGRVGNSYFFRTVRSDGKINIEAEIEIA